MPLLAARSLYEAPAIVVTPPMEGLVAGGGRWYWPQEVTVQLVGVAANPQVGSGTLNNIDFNLYPFPKRDIELTKPYTAPPRRAPVKAPKPIVVRLTGVKSVSAVGTGTVKTVFELLDEEILILLEAA
jgi:hypothetical protein